MALTKTSNKRARASSPPPPAKRVKKSGTKTKPVSRSSTKDATHRVLQTAINALPSPPAKHRPSYTLFVWGCGDAGKLGLGPIPDGAKDEWNKPKRNTLFEQMAEMGKFGGKGAGLVAIAAGGMHSLVVDENGTVWSFGINDEGTLGRETKKQPNPDVPQSFLPSGILEASPSPVQALVDEGFRAVKVTAGDNMSAALDSEGRLRVWGSFKDSQGVVGFSTQSIRQFIPKPVLVSPRSFLPPEKFTSISAGFNHLLALTTFGDVYAFGNGEYGQLGRKVIARRKINGTAPGKVVLGTRSRKAVLIGAGGHQSFAVDNEGVVWAWGLNTMGQLGVGMDAGSLEATLVHSPLRVIGLSKEELGSSEIVQISGGDCFTLFLASDGRVYASGSTYHGRLGLAETDEALVNLDPERQFLSEPVLVTFPEPVPSQDPVVHVSAGSRHAIAITESGVMFSWGEHNQGGLGLGECSNVQTPTVVVRREGSWRAKAVSCGGPHCLALLEKKS